MDIHKCTHKPPESVEVTFTVRFVFRTPATAITSLSPLTLNTDALGPPVTRYVKVSPSLMSMVLRVPTTTLGTEGGVYSVGANRMAVGQAQGSSPHLRGGGVRGLTKT